MFFCFGSSYSCLSRFERKNVSTFFTILTLEFGIFSSSFGIGHFTNMDFTCLCELITNNFFPKQEVFLEKVWRRFITSHQRKWIIFMIFFQKFKSGHNLATKKQSSRKKDCGKLYI